MTIEDDHAAARLVAAKAHEVRRISERGRRSGRPGSLIRDLFGWPASPGPAPPWHDTASRERSGWRVRTAHLPSEAFAVHYRICRRCRLGWVEQPYTMPQYERCGLASAGLAALRAEHPGLAWHTLGGHFPRSQPFWKAVGAEVAGGYQQRQPCAHITI